MIRLEELIKNDLGAISDGIAYVAIGKAKDGNGRRVWKFEIIWPDDTADESVIAPVKYLFYSDPNTILVNAYQNAWIGFTGEGAFCDGGNVRDVARRIRWGYKIGRCRVTFDDVKEIVA